MLWGKSISLYIDDILIAISNKSKAITPYEESIIWKMANMRRYICYVIWMISIAE